MPPELARALALDSWCKAYGALPWPGSIYQQPAIPFLKWQSVLTLGSAEQAPRVPADPLAELPMELL